MIHQKHIGFRIHFSFLHGFTSHKKKIEPVECMHDLSFFPGKEKNSGDHYTAYDK